MVSVDQPASVLDARVVARAHRSVEPLHNHVYFVPETDEHLTAPGEVAHPPRWAPWARAW